MSNPQSWNRFSYVLNNPVRFNDPTGHMVANDDDGGCYPCNQLPQPTNTPSGDEDPDVDDLEEEFEENKGCHDLGISDVNCVKALNNLTNITIGVDTISALISFGEAAIADLFFIGAMSLALFSGGSLSGALVIAIQADVLIAQIAGAVENNLGWVSLTTTGIGDYLAGYTRYSDGELYVGKDTIVAGRNTALGFIPESNLDAAVSISQLKYDMDRLNGVKSGDSILINASNIDQIVGQTLFFDSPLEDFVNFLTGAGK